MACEICGRSSCTRSFHSIEEQNDFDDRQLMSSDVDELRCEIQSLEEEKDNIYRESVEECVQVVYELPDSCTMSEVAEYLTDLLGVAE